MSEKIAIKYVTSDNRTIILSESHLPETAKELSPLERRKFHIEIAALLALIATFICYVVLAILQYEANILSQQNIELAQDSLKLTQQSLKESRQALITSRIPWLTIYVTKFEIVGRVFKIKKIER